MLVEFSVTNFLSFKEKQTFSMVASQRDVSLTENLIPLSLPGLADISLIKTAVLYGANASGKSNLLNAFRFVDWFVESSATELKPDETIPVEPFRLSKISSQEPSEFELTILVDNVRYQYGFVVDNERVHSEWLYAYPGGKPQRWYERNYDVQTEKYDWEFSQKHFRGAKDSLKKQTRANALFLSTAAQFNHEQLLRIYRWFQQKFLPLAWAETPLDLSLNATKNFISKNKHHISKVMQMLVYADLGISSIDFKEEDFNASMLPEDMPKNVKEEILKAAKGKKVQRLQWFHHAPDLDEAICFETDSESAGTLRYFSVLGPWLDAMDKGLVLAIDELGANIHPLLVRALLKSFQHANAQKNEAQVVVTTHDTTLLDRELLRRDQVWFTEKDKHGATHLYPLTDFHPRKDDSLERGYLAGRYGAIPFLTGDLAP